MATKKKTPSEVPMLIDALVDRLAEIPLIKIIQVIESTVLIAQSQKMKISLVNNNSIFQPFETVKDIQVCTLTLIKVGQDAACLPVLFKELMEMGCGIKVIRGLKEIPYLIEDLLDEYH